MTVHPKVSEFIVFCESQRPNREYDWDSSTYCALGEFCNYNSNGWHDEFEQCNNLASIRPRTFGALAKRLRSVIAEGGMYTRMRPQVVAMPGTVYFDIYEG